MTDLVPLIHLDHIDPDDRRALTRGFAPPARDHAAGDAVLWLTTDTPMIDLTGLDDRAAVAARHERGDHHRAGRLHHEPPPRPIERAVVANHAVAVTATADPARIEALARTWLTDREHRAFHAKGARGQVGHLLGRVAAKQAVQRHLDARGFAPVGAERIDIANDPAGRPVVSVRGARVAARNLRVSIAHTATVALAVATASRPTDRPGAPDLGNGLGIGIGIDVEPIAPRSSRFEALTLTAAEQRLVPTGDDDRDTWLTRLWTAKEAAAKATGRGLQGRPKQFAVTRVDGERLRIADRWIATERTDFAGTAHIVAVAADHRTERSWRPS